MELLKQPEYRGRYKTELPNSYDVLGNDPSSEQVDEETAENGWAEFKHTISEVCQPTAKENNSKTT